MSLTTDVDLKQPMQSYDFQVSAKFQWGATSAEFDGSYASAGKTFSITASMSQVTLESIFDIFEALSDDSIILPEVDVRIDSASLSIASGDGLSISLQNVQVEGHTAGDAQLTLGPNGAVIKGDITSSTSIAFDDIELTKAYISIDLPAKSSGQQPSVMLGGEVSFEGIVFDALVHLYKGDASAKGIQWTVYASLSTISSLSHFKSLAKLNGSFLDLELTQVVFAAASQDDPSIGDANIIPSDFTLHQGIQVCATVQPIPALDDLMRSSSPTSGILMLFVCTGRSTSLSSCTTGTLCGS